MLAYLAHVNGIDSVAGMFPAHVRTRIGRVVRAVRTIGTIEPRRLAALKLCVIVQIVPVPEHARAVRAGKLAAS